MAEKRKFKKSKQTLTKKTKIAQSDIIELKFGKGKDLIVRSIGLFKKKLSFGSSDKRKED